MSSRTYHDNVAASRDLELCQHPDIVDELDGRVHELLVVHVSASNGEDVVCVEFGLHQVGIAGLAHGNLF